MTDAVFEGTVAGFKTIGSRKLVAVTIECPIEHLSHIATVAEHGAWVAVARLAAPIAQEKAKRRWHEMRPSAQVAIRVDEPLFRTFLIEEKGMPATYQVEGWLKHLLGIQSKKELNAPCGALDLWNEIDRAYQAWQLV